MKYELQIKKIERHYRPDNSDINQTIKSISKRTLDSFWSDTPVQIGEIIRLNKPDNLATYKVEEIIRIIDAIEDYCILEVSKVNTCKLYKYTNSSWTEDIPLIIDIEEEVREE